MSKSALITGITGQDGSYLAEFLLAKKYQVHGLVRRSSSGNTTRIDHLCKDGNHDGRLDLHHGDVTDGQALANLILQIQPDEIYNLAAQSHVRVSFDQPAYTLQVVGAGALNVLEAAKQLQETKPLRLFQASSSEMYGDVRETPQRESTPFCPQSPYACAKVYAHHQAINYRQSFGMFVVNGIMFNHESERRGETFVTRKITRAAGRIKLGLQKKLYLGNLDAKRDWGYAQDYIQAMWLALQHSVPDDYVIATEKTHSVRQFLAAVFRRLDLLWQDHVEIDQRLFRPSEVHHLLGDSTKIRQTLGWQPKTNFETLAAIMTDHDLELAGREVYGQGFNLEGA